MARRSFLWDRDCSRFLATYPVASDGPSVRRCLCHSIWSCSMRGFACHRRYRRRGALLPHLFTLTRLRPPGFGAAGPLPRACHAGVRRTKAGGMFSVPLSVRLPCPGVTRRTALWSSDFPPAFAPSALQRAIVWLTATFPLSNPKAQIPKPKSQELETWDFQLGIWHLGFGIWDFPITRLFPA